MPKSMTTLGVLGVSVAMNLGCAADVAVDEEVGTSEQALDSCTGPNMGKWQHLANLAVATAQEMGELNASRQFALGTSTVSGMYGTSILVLSDYGRSVCAARPGGTCPMVQALLDLQEMPNDVYVPQADFNTIDYRLTLVDGYQRLIGQINSYLSNRAFSQLAEDHSTTLLGKEGMATCGAPWFSFSIKRDFHFRFSSSGPIAGMYCTQIVEWGDPNGWNDNYLCSERNLGMKWSYSGPIAGMTCVNVNEPSDPHYWNDNYLCTPEDWGLTWSSNGIPSGKECVAFNEPSDAGYGWYDNYLCWNPAANLNHPRTLCDEFLIFGGASACGGNNPYIDFSVSNDLSKFKIDPTDYTSGTVSTGSTGSCVTSLPYVGTTGVAGACCYVNSSGTYGTLTKIVTKPNVYYCRS
jgi:hypothetical protein